MPPLRSCTCLAALLLIAGLARATVGESGVFAFDTRDSVSTVVGESGVFAFDTRLVDGLGDDANSGTFVLDTRSLYPQALVITGPAVCPVGGRVSFEAWAQYGGNPENVTAQTVWSASGAPLNATGLERAVFSGNHLTAGLATWSEPVLLTATYRYGNGQVKSGTYQVTIGDGNTLGVGIRPGGSNGQYLRPAGDGSYVWQLAVNTFGQVQTTSGVSYQWYLNDVLQGTATSSFTQEYTGTPTTVRLKVVATDSQGHTGTDTKLIPLHRPALNEPGQKYRASQPAGITLLNAQGQLLVFDATRSSHGLIVLTHGMTDSPNADWLIGPNGLATAIENRLISENKPLPTVAVLGWEYGANPFLKDLGSPDLNKTAQSLKIAVNILAAVPYLGELFWNLNTIEGDSGAYALALAQWIKDESAPGVDHINVAKPMHFIGHSAGGFVVNGGAYWLRTWGVATVSQVTFLDTPKIKSSIFTTLNPTVMERYVSSALGATVPELGEKPYLLTKPKFLLLSPNGITQLSNYIAPGLFYRRQILTSLFNPIAGPNIPTPGAHNYSHDWYITTANGTASEDGGFVTSPFMTGQTSAPAPLENQAFAMMSETDSTPASPPATMDGFSTFGSVTGSGSPYVLTEDTNAGIQQTMTLPVGADALQFRYQFTTAGDGDFIAVYFGDNPPLFIGPDVAAARTAPMEVNVPLQGYEGQTGTLVIKLVSQGQTNAVAQIDQITLSTTDDPDHDGLTITLEQTLGTNSLLYDTDSDGIGDWEEVNTTLTNPLNADSDSDGLTDAQEIIAGTGGMDATSVFRTTGTTRAVNGAVTVTWAAKAGKIYRVQRSDTPDFTDYTVVGDDLPGVEPTTSFTDSTVPGGMQRMFYRVEVQ